MLRKFALLAVALIATAQPLTAGAGDLQRPIICDDIPPHVKRDGGNQTSDDDTCPTDDGGGGGNPQPPPPPRPMPSPNCVTVLFTNICFDEN